MKIFTFIVTAFFASSICIAQNRSINFETSSFSDIKAKARKENKLIFMDAYTSWCGPCKWMAKNVFTNDTVADYFNSHLVNAKIDMEKGEGLIIAKLYGVTCYPNLLFIDGEGNLVHLSAGSMMAKEFISLAEAAQIPKTRYAAYKNDYELKKTDSKFLAEYLNIISKTCYKFDNVVKDYFNIQKEDELYSRTNWNMIKNYCSDFKSREFKYLLKNETKYKKAYTGDSVNAVITNVFMNSVDGFLSRKEIKEEDYKSFKTEVSNTKFSSLDEVLFKLDLSYFQKSNNWKQFAVLVVDKGDTYFHTVSEYNNIAWTIYEKSDDKAALLKAESWMQKAVNDKDGQSWFIYDTYACVLYKLKKKSEAKLAANKAIELAKASGVKDAEYKGTTELLQKIEILQ